MAKPSIESAVASNAVLRNAGGRQRLIDLPLFIIVRPFGLKGRRKGVRAIAGQKHSPETRNPEPLRKLAHPIGLWKRLTIGATLSFVNRTQASAASDFHCGSEPARECGVTVTLFIG